MHVCMNIFFLFWWDEKDGDGDEPRGWVGLCSSLFGSGAYTYNIARYTRVFVLRLR